MRLARIIRTLFWAALALIGLLIVYFIHISPIAFQKAAMINPVDAMAMSVFKSDEAFWGRVAPDVRKLLEPIPYRHAQPVYDILPRARYHSTIEQGNGNCSNLTFGMAFLLLRDNYAFQIVHLIPYEGFLTGAGHTVLNMPYQLDDATHIGLVDVLEGGVLRSGTRSIDLAMLERKYLQQPFIEPLNSRKDGLSIYYNDFLNNAAVGIVPSAEVARYFDFIDRVYVPLGHKRLERVTYSALAIVAGRYPLTYVTQEDYARLFAHKFYLVWAAQALIWLLRLLPCLIFLLLISYLPSIRLARVSGLRASHTN